MPSRSPGSQLESDDHVILLFRLVFATLTPSALPSFGAMKVNIPCISPMQKLAGISVLTVIICAAYLAFYEFERRYIGSEVANGAPLSFSVSLEDEVFMSIFTGARYDLKSDEGEQEWSKILPSPGGHVVHIADDSSSEPKPYTVTLFHQLKCLDIIRRQYVSPPTIPISSLTKHCLNYLRQTMICRPNLRLESVKDSIGIVRQNYETACRDWTKLYAEAERNQKEFASQRG